ncbi:MAG: hypothetical protein WCT28_01385 [Patescibacteria group bacterium]
MRKYWFMTLLGLAACENGGEECDNCTAACEDCGDDTGEVTLGSAIVNIAADRLGTSEVCTVNLTGTMKTYIEDAGEDISVVAPDVYQATVGDIAFTTQFGFPVHVDGNDEYWAASTREVEVKKDDVFTDSFILFNLFEPGNYSCSYDDYAYDGTSASLKGEYREHREFEPVQVWVDQVGVVHTEDEEDESENWDRVGGADDYLRIIGDQLELVLVEEGFNTHLITSQIDNTRFSMTVVDEILNYVTDLTCTR